MWFNTQKQFFITISVVQYEFVSWSKLMIRIASKSQYVYFRRPFIGQSMDYMYATKQVDMNNLVRSTASYLNLNIEYRIYVSLSIYLWKFTSDICYFYVCMLRVGFNIFTCNYVIQTNINIRNGKMYLKWQNGVIC